MCKTPLCMKRTQVSEVMIETKKKFAPMHKTDLPALVKIKD